MKEDGILDNVWAFFLHDYDNLDDDETRILSVESSSESETCGEYDSSMQDDSLYMSESELKSNLSQEEQKMAILYNSLQRSSNLLKQVELGKNSHRKSKTSNSMKKDMEYSGRNLEAPEYGEHTFYDEYHADSIGRDYYEMKTKIRQKLNTRGSGSVNRAIKFHSEYVEAQEDREHALYDEYNYIDAIDGNFEIQRDAPPKMIFVDNESEVGSETRMVRRDINDDTIHSIYSDARRNVSNDLPRKEIHPDTRKYVSSIQNDSKGHHHYAQIAVERNEANTKAMQRKELVRRIALLRIKATKARMAKIEEM